MVETFGNSSVGGAGSANTRNVDRQSNLLSTPDNHNNNNNPGAYNPSHLGVKSINKGQGNRVALSSFS